MPLMMKTRLIVALLTSLAETLWSADFQLSQPVTHPGAPDGSAGVASGTSHFIDVCDENNFLRLYPSDTGANPKVLLDLNQLLGFPKDNGEFKECDLEGAARIGDRIYWIGSHSRSGKKGKVQPSRQVLFATKVTGVDEETKLELLGKPFKGLRNALIEDERLKSFKLKEAAEKKPEEPDGWNIESLCAEGESLLIGFRNPVPDGKALLVPLKNPAAVIDSGASPTFGEPMLLDLHGLGTRDMARWGEKFIIVAGDFRDRNAEGAQPSRLFQWSGQSGDAPTPLDGDLGDLNPEGVVVYGEGPEAKLQLLSDDGGEAFRSAWISKVAQAKPAKSTSNETAITDLEKSAWESYKNKQADTFKKLMSQDYCGAYANALKTLDTEVADMAKADLRDYSLADMKVVFPSTDVAVVTYKATIQETFGGKDMSGTYNTASVWVKNGEKWLEVLHTELKAQ